MVSPVPPNPREHVGANNPPPQFRFGDELRDEIAQDYDYRVKRRDELTAGALQWIADHPEVNTDAEAGELAGVIAQIYEEIKAVNAEREGVKAPYLSACGIVDGFFNGQIIAKLEELHRKLNADQTEYLSARADRIKKAAEETARKAREKLEAAQREQEAADKLKRDAEEKLRKAEAERAEAQRKIDAAEAAGRAAPKTAVAKVKKAETVAAQAEKVVEKAETKIAAAAETATRADLQERRAAVTANSTTTERSRVRGVVAKTSLAVKYAYRVVDFSKVPAHYLTVDDARVKAAIAGKNGLRDIPGLEIYPDENAVNRR